MHITLSLYPRYTGLSFRPSRILPHPEGLLVYDALNNAYGFPSDDPLYGYYHSLYYNPTAYTPRSYWPWYGLSFFSRRGFRGGRRW